MLFDLRLLIIAYLEPCNFNNIFIALCGHFLLHVDPRAIPSQCVNQHIKKIKEAVMIIRRDLSYISALVPVVHDTLYIVAIILQSNPKKL